MPKSEDVVLEIQNVTQKNEPQSLKFGSIGKKLSGMIVSNTQKKRKDGLIEVILVLDPKKAKKGELNNV